MVFVKAGTHNARKLVQANQAIFIHKAAFHCQRVPMVLGKHAGRLHLSITTCCVSARIQNTVCEQND